MHTIAIVQGFLVSATLIIAIGPQNTFVLNQGLQRQHVFLTALVCSLCDAILISIGVLGIGRLFTTHPLLIELARWLGAGFLFCYGALSFRAAFHPKILETRRLGRATHQRKKTVLTLLALSFLNPHAYLDTMVLIGSISAQHHGLGRPLFGIGAALASFLWFFTIAYGSRLLTPLFTTVIAWRILDIFIGCTMWIIAVLLVIKS